MTKSKLSAERARELFSYDPETGGLRWRVSTSNRTAKGEAAGSLGKNGYLTVRADKSLYPVHRVVWLLSTGAWPRQVIDHKNGNRSDNRLANLRDVSVSSNQENRRRAGANSTTGFLGASPKREKFRARIRVRGREVSLGSFHSLEEAYTAYLVAKRVLHAGCTI